MFHAGLDARLVEQTLADHVADAVHVRRHFEQVRQQPPRQRPLAVQPRRRRALEPLEVRLGPVLLLLVAARLLPQQVLPLLQQHRVLHGLGNLLALLFPAEDADVVFVREGVDEPLGVELRAAGAAEDLVGDARIDQFLLAEWALDQAGDDDRTGGQVDSGGERFRTQRDRQQFLLE